MRSPMVLACCVWLAFVVGGCSATPFGTASGRPAETQPASTPAEATLLSVLNGG